MQYDSNTNHKTNNEMKYRNIIGIDPDTNKSGVALLDVSTRILEITTLTFPKVLKYIEWANEMAIDNRQSLLVVVEAGWLNAKSNFHGQTGYVGQKVAKNVGANHQTGKHIIEWCEEIGVDVELQKPLVKGWKGRNGKITHEELAYFTGITGRTSEEGRDAGLIAWNYAGLPIKVKSYGKENRDNRL